MTSSSMLTIGHGTNKISKQSSYWQKIAGFSELIKKMHGTYKHFHYP